ncbi:hypothetical protein GCM10027566_20270 [Arachidicoccus ginsenosidivorans]
MNHQDKEVALRKIRSRIDWMCKDKIAAFSPTISPAPKSVDRSEIESIYEGARFYVERGVKDLVFQKKYMGSYCDIYLHKNKEETYFVSRNGYKIDYIDLTEARQTCENLYNRFDWNGLELAIIQAELLPWHIMGSNLIAREFEGYLEAHQKRLAYFKTSTILEKIEAVKAAQVYNGFFRDKEVLSGNAFKKKYPSHEIRQMEAIGHFDLPDLSSYENGIQVYARQIHHYGKEGALYFKPFNILKLIYTDGKEVIPNDNLTYRLVNDDLMMELHIDTELTLEEQLAPVYDWFSTLCAGMEEGIVIKAQKAFLNDLPPALKVRNNDYLTMIYGVDFQRDLELQIRKRKISRKLDCSMNDWMINYRLLEIPYSEIDSENYYYRNLMLDRILQEETESKLDPSL